MSPAFLTEASKVLAGVRFDVHSLELPRRSGGTTRREVVVPPNVVVILPLLDTQTGTEPALKPPQNDRVVLIRNERFAVDQTLWELPAGTLEPGEAPQSCAARELTEETGCVAEQLTRSIQFYPSPGFCTELMTLYLAEGLTFQGQNLEKTERITTEVMTLAEAIQMIRDNQIRDAKTITGLLYYSTFGKDGV